MAARPAGSDGWGVDLEFTPQAERQGKPDLRTSGDVLAAHERRIAEMAAELQSLRQVCSGLQSGMRHLERLVHRDVNAETVGVELVEGSRVIRLGTDPAGRQWRVTVREGGSISLHYVTDALPGVTVVVYDTLDHEGVRE